MRFITKKITKGIAQNIAYTHTHTHFLTHNCIAYTLALHTHTLLPSPISFIAHTNFALHTLTHTHTHK